eukprot:6546624-Heterocapsa_arctica.AAC.1
MIRQVLVSELQAKGVKVEGFWDGLAFPPAVDSKRSAATTFDNLNDATWIAKDKGLEQGMLIFEKTVGSTSLFQITDIGKTVKVASYTLGLGTTTIAELPLETIVKGWQVFRGEPPQMLPTTWVDRRLFAVGNKVAQQEAAKAKLFLYLQGMAEKHGDADDMVNLLIRPTCVVSKRSIKKGELVLVPTVLIKDIVFKSEADDAACSVDGMTLYIKRPTQPTTADDNTWKDDAFVAPYFWVGYTDDEHECNVEFAVAK